MNSKYCLPNLSDKNSANTHISLLEERPFKVSKSSWKLPSITLREKCPCSELFWSAFSRIWTEYREILRISPYLVRMRENADKNNSEYEHFLHSVSKHHEEWI